MRWSPSRAARRTSGSNVVSRSSSPSRYMRQVIKAPRAYPSRRAAPYVRVRPRAAAPPGVCEVDERPTVDQLQALEREVLIPGGRRWFVVREGGAPVAFAAILALEGSAYLDHVVTFPASRRRGHAQARP